MILVNITIFCGWNMPTWVPLHEETKFRDDRYNSSVCIVSFSDWPASLSFSWTPCSLRRVFDVGCHLRVTLQNGLIDRVYETRIETYLLRWNRSELGLCGSKSPRPCWWNIHTSCAYCTKLTTFESTGTTPVLYLWLRILRSMNTGLFLLCICHSRFVDIVQNEIFGLCICIYMARSIHRWFHRKSLRNFPTPPPPATSNALVFSIIRFPQISSIYWAPHLLNIHIQMIFVV